jgi:hypothetical protein
MEELWVFEAQEKGTEKVVEVHKELQGLRVVGFKR